VLWAWEQAAPFREQLPLFSLPVALQVSLGLSGVQGFGGEGLLGASLAALQNEVKAAHATAITPSWKDTLGMSLGL
jgi:hypothetical protein